MDKWERQTLEDTLVCTGVWVAFLLVVFVPIGGDVFCNGEMMG